MGAGRRRWEGQSWKLGDVEKSVPQQHRGSTPNANATAPDGFRLIARMESSAHFPLTHPPADSPEESNQHNPLARVNRRGWWCFVFFLKPFPATAGRAVPGQDRQKAFKALAHTPPAGTAAVTSTEGGRFPACFSPKRFNTQQSLNFGSKHVGFGIRCAHAGFPKTVSSRCQMNLRLKQARGFLFTTEPTCWKAHPPAPYAAHGQKMNRNDSHQLPDRL